ncbi:MAG: hypothetical protein AAFY65_14905 [Pseudomonadota bacterium]
MSVTLAPRLSLVGSVAGLILLCTVPTAGAQTRLTPKAFLDEVVGQRVEMRIVPSLRLVGVETILSRSRTLWRRSNGSCTRGTISVRAAAICFTYEDGPDIAHCWLPFEDAKGLYVVSTTTGEVQRIRSATDDGPACTQDLTS